MKLLIIFLFTFNIAVSQIHTKYVIKDIAELTGKMYVNAKQISTNTSRKNIAGTKVILKFEGNIPLIFVNDKIYNHSEIRSELLKEEWEGYPNGLKNVGKFIVTDIRYKEQISIIINDWMIISPISIKNGWWAVSYELYTKYQSIIDNNIDLDKFTIKNLSKKEFINQNNQF